MKNKDSLWKERCLSNY